MILVDQRPVHILSICYHKRVRYSLLKWLNLVTAQVGLPVEVLIPEATRPLHREHVERINGQGNQGSISQHPKHVRTHLICKRNISHIYVYIERESDRDREHVERINGQGNQGSIAQHPKHVSKLIHT
jgi:hypothetical protein